jgi:hypothetical protein
VSEQRVCEGQIAVDFECASKARVIGRDDGEYVGRAYDVIVQGDVVGADV